MSRRKVTHCNVLDLIANAGAALGAGLSFFLSLKTSPLAGASGYPSIGGRQRAPDRDGEKVLISGSGSRLVFKVSGPSGRHCAVSYATTDSREHYKAVAGGRGVIGRDGLCTIEVNLRDFPSQKVYFRVVTGSSSDFLRDARGTEPFEIILSNKAISSISGVHDRILDNRNSIVSAASTCWKML